MARKKTARKKAPAKKLARKRIAVNAKSRATGKPPSTRLKRRRKRNTVAGAYPNPAPRRKVATKRATKRNAAARTKAGFVIEALPVQGPAMGEKLYFNGTVFARIPKNRAAIYPTGAQARAVFNHWYSPKLQEMFADAGTTIKVVSAGKA
jgi:hypothetical protein